MPHHDLPDRPLRRSVQPKLKTGAVEPLCKPTMRPSDIGNGGEASCLRGEAQPRDILQKLLKIVPRGTAHGSVCTQKGQGSSLHLLRISNRWIRISLRIEPPCRRGFELCRTRARTTLALSAGRAQPLVVQAISASTEPLLSRIQNVSYLGCKLSVGEWLWNKVEARV